jgi:hypothetical protein
MKRSTSQGQAMRSILGRSRVIQRDGRSPVTPSSGRLRMQGSAVPRQWAMSSSRSTPGSPPSIPPCSRRAFQPAERSVRTASSLTLWPYTQ